MTAYFLIKMFEPENFLFNLLLLYRCGGLGQIIHEKNSG